VPSVDESVRESGTRAAVLVDEHGIRRENSWLDTTAIAARLT
jgi:hypothetical protein